MQILKEYAQTEIIVKKSRFIAVAIPCNHIGNVKKLIDSARKQHMKANHVVHAAIVNDNFSYSDDKEPKNSAGKPVFEILKGSKINNICVLVIRYFGGILLGTGGLAKAYKDSVRQLLQTVKTEEYIEKKIVSFNFSYNVYEKAKYIFSSLNAVIEEEKFTFQVSVSVLVPVENIKTLENRLSELAFFKDEKIPTEKN